MKNKIILLLIIILLLLQLAYARNYGSGAYGIGVYNPSDTDGDGYDDDDDWLLYNESYVNVTGITRLNISVGGDSTSGIHNGTKQVVFYDVNDPIINFTHHFNASNVLDLSKVKIQKTPQYLIVNFSGQLSTNKTLYFADNNVIGLCVKDAEISTIDEVSSGCDGNNETDFTTCLGNSAGITLDGIICTDEGTRIVIKNLQHSAIKGILSSSTPDSPGGGGSGGGGGGGGGSSSAKVSVENISQCSSNSDCELGQYCFDNSCYDAECVSDDQCMADEACWNLRCVRLFDVIIKEFQSPVKLGDYFEFTYLIIGRADFDHDVEVDYWIENEEGKITSGKDTIFISGFEEKVETAKLFLPSDAKSGNHTFRIQVNFGTYFAESHKTIEISIKEDDGTATIKQIPTQTQTVLVVPYFETAKSIDILNENDQLILSVDVSKYSKEKGISFDPLLIGGLIAGLLIVILIVFFIKRKPKEKKKEKKHHKK